MNPTLSKEQILAALNERHSPQKQALLSSAHVAVAGLGGLGSNIAVMLARSGVGQLLLVDYDVVDVTNLNRQMYYIQHIGKPKAQALPEILYQINPYSNYQSCSVKVTERNVHELFSQYPIVCEAFDAPDQKAMLVREVLTQCPNTTVVSGNGMAGYGDINEIQTSRKMRHLYVCGDQHTDVGEGIGLMAPRVAACAAHEANKVIQLIMEA